MRGAMKALFCGACLAVALLPAGSATATFPGANGKIAFERSDSQPRSDIWVMEADGSGQTNLTNSSIFEGDPKWSADGTRIAFVREAPSAFSQIYTMKGDGSDLQQVTDGSFDVDPSWSPDGERLVFIRRQSGTSDIYTVRTDGTDLQRLTTGLTQAFGTVWSPDGSRIAYSDGPPAGPRDLFSIGPAGGVPQRLTSTSVAEETPDWSPDGRFLVFEDPFSGLLGTIRRDGTDQRPLPAQGAGWFQPVWSPDGNRFAVTSNSEIATINQIGSDANHLADVIEQGAPDWQAVQPPPPPDPGYPRPKGATPLHVSLVPAYEPCSTSNREHGPPLAFASCAPPTQSSHYLTVGTADSNGRPTRFIGSVRLQTLPGNPSTPADEADVALTADIADVLCAVDLPGLCTGVLSDYAGELRAAFTARITDRAAGYSGNQPGTLQDLFEFPFTIPCAATSDPDTGGACALATSFDALLPGVIGERKRTIWQVGQIDVADGGADGSAASDDNTVFAGQGVFVP